MQTLAIIMPDNNAELTGNVKGEKFEQLNMPTPLQPVEISDDDKNVFLSTLTGIIDEQMLFQPWNADPLDSNESDSDNPVANESEPISNKNGLMCMANNCIDGYSFFINEDKASAGSLKQRLQLWMKADNNSDLPEFYKTAPELQNRILFENHLLQDLSSEPNNLQLKKAESASNGNLIEADTRANTRFAPTPIKLKDDFIGTDTPLKGSIKEQLPEGIQIDTIMDSASDEKSGLLKKVSHNNPDMSNNRFSENPPEQSQNRLLSENRLLQDLSSEPGNLQLKKAVSALEDNFIRAGAPLKGPIKEQYPEGTQIDTIMDSASDEKSGTLKKVSHNNPDMSNNRFFDKSSIVNKIEAVETDKKENTLLFSNNSSPGKISQNITELKCLEHDPKAIESQVLSQITEKAVISIKNGKQEIKIRLKPDSLGLLRINIKTENNRVMLKIFTETPMAKEIIQSNINHLNNALSNHGLEMDKLEVFIGYNPEQNEGSLNKKEFFQPSNRHNESEEQDDELSFESDKTTRTKGAERGAGLVDFFA